MASARHIGGHGERDDELADDLVSASLGKLTVVGARELARVHVHATRRRPLSTEPPDGNDVVDVFLRRMASQLRCEE